MPCRTIACVYPTYLHLNTPHSNNESQEGNQEVCTRAATLRNGDMGTNLHEYSQFDGFAASQHVEQCFSALLTLHRCFRVTITAQQFCRDHVTLILVPKLEYCSTFLSSNLIGCPPTAARVSLQQVSRVYELYVLRWTNRI